MRVSLMKTLFASVALVAVACNKKEEATSAPPSTAPAAQGSAAPAPTPAPAGSTMNDAEIAAIVVAANQVDIEAGQLALKKSNNPEVKKFAERMVTDHTAVNQAAVELVTKLKVTPQESEASKSLAAGGSTMRANLEKLEGAAFDRAYVDNEVAYHEAVIGVLDTQLIPSASNKELKDALVGAKPAFDAHLQHAKQIQSALATGATAAHVHGHK
jgi:putative membrane protein